MDFDFLNSASQYSQMEYAAAMMMQMENTPPAHRAIIDFSVGGSSGGGSSSSSGSTSHSPPATLPLHPHLAAAYPLYPCDAASFDDNKQASIEAMREMIFRIAAMQPVHIDPESVKPPKRRNVRISKDPQSIAARHRRERISERIRILQRLVPGGTKMDTASMLDEAIHYVKFLKEQVQCMEHAAASGGGAPPLPVGVADGAQQQYLAELYQQMCEDQAQLQQYMMRS